MGQMRKEPSSLGQMQKKPNSFEREQADRSKKEQMKQKPNNLDQRQKEQHNFELYHSDSKHNFLLKYFTFMLISSDLIFFDNWMIFFEWIFSIRCD